MAVRWIGPSGICGGRLREAGDACDDLSASALVDLRARGCVEDVPAEPVTTKPKAAKPAPAEES